MPRYILAIDQGTTRAATDNFVQKLAINAGFVHDKKNSFASNLLAYNNFLDCFTLLAMTKIMLIIH